MLATTSRRPEFPVVINMILSSNICRYCSRESATDYRTDIFGLDMVYVGAPNSFLLFASKTPIDDLHLQTLPLSGAPYLLLHHNCTWIFSLSETEKRVRKSVFQQWHLGKVPLQIFHHVMFTAVAMLNDWNPWRNTGR